MNFFENLLLKSFWGCIVRNWRHCNTHFGPLKVNVLKWEKSPPKTLSMYKIQVHMGAITLFIRGLSRKWLLQGPIKKYVVAIYKMTWKLCRLLKLRQMAAICFPFISYKFQHQPSSMRTVETSVLFFIGYFLQAWTWRISNSAWWLNFYRNETGRMLLFVSERRSCGARRGLLRGQFFLAVLPFLDCSSRSSFPEHVSTTTAWLASGLFSFSRFSTVSPSRAPVKHYIVGGWSSHPVFSFFLSGAFLPSATLRFLRAARIRARVSLHPASTCFSVQGLEPLWRHFLFLFRGGLFLLRGPWFHPDCVRSAARCVARVRPFFPGHSFVCCFRHLS